jgi:hypothetical protein
VLARRNLVDISTICSAILLAHVSSSWWFESQFARNPNAPEGERASVPRREGRKFGLYILFTFGSTLGVLCLRALVADAGLGIWQSTRESSLAILREMLISFQSLLDTTYFEIIICSVGYQLALYFAIRLAHRGSTVGELGLVCFGGIALTMEMLNMTKARVRFLLTPVNRLI